MNVDLYYLSLFVTLTLPDICGAIDSENGRSNAEKYKEWFDKYIAPEYPGCLTANDCYVFRCSLLHQGSSQHPSSSYYKILFVEPRRTSNVMHCVISESVSDAVMIIDVGIFCRDMLAGVERWLSEVEDTEKFKENYDKFVRRHPDGVSPYISGVSLIG